MPLIHNDTMPLQQQLFSTITRAGTIGFLTDAIVAAATDRASLKRGMRAALVPNDTQNFRSLFTRAVDFLQDADINGKTTVAALAATTGYSSVPNTTILE